MGIYSFVGQGQIYLMPCLLGSLITQGFPIPSHEPYLEFTSIPGRSSPFQLLQSEANVPNFKSQLSKAALITHRAKKFQIKPFISSINFLMYSPKKPQKYKNTTMKNSEISHFGHPQHKLSFEYSQFPFKCDGCKEVGIGSRYKCSLCDYDLHMHCALPSPSIYHPFYPKCSFQFLSRPPGDIPRFCNACEKGISGFLYHCPSCGFDLHPCCAKLPMLLDDGEVKLYLYQKVSSACHRCGKKGRSWSYRSKCKSYNLHVACVREMVVESWPEIYTGSKKESHRFGNEVPSLKNTIQSSHSSSGRSKGKVKKCCEMAGMAVQFVVSAVLGDPTVLIGGIVGSLVSRA